MSIKKSLGCKKQKLPRDSWSMRNFCTESEVFHGNLVHNSKKAPQKTKSELGSPQPRLLLFSPRAGSRILSACSHIFFILFFLPEDLLFFWGSMHKVIRAQTSNTLFRHLSKTTQVSEFLFWIPTREHLWDKPGLTMSGSGMWLCSGAKVLWLTC